MEKQSEMKNKNVDVHLTFAFQFKVRHFVHYAKEMFIFYKAKQGLIGEIKIYDKEENNLFGTLSN